MLDGYVSRTRVCKWVRTRVCVSRTAWYVKGVYTGSYSGTTCAANPKPGPKPVPWSMTSLETRKRARLCSLWLLAAVYWFVAQQVVDLIEANVLLLGCCGREGVALSRRGERVLRLQEEVLLF